MDTHPPTLNKPSKFITDVKEVDVNERSLHLSANATNISRLKDLEIENLWLVGAKEKDLVNILSSVKLKYLNLYHILAKDLIFLETQINLDTIILEWNTKTTQLWDISCNRNLRTLAVKDFSKLADIDQISLAGQIDNLTLGGGHSTPMKIKTLNPLSRLVNLKYLGLTNLKVADNSLAPIAKLINLEELELSNQFETKEYAFLSTRLNNTKCEKFTAINTRVIKGANNQIVWDTMVTGKKKPFLLSTQDQNRIDKYVKEFEKLQKLLAE